jgi:hypothetical protein
LEEYHIGKLEREARVRVLFDRGAQRRDSNLEPIKGRQRAGMHRNQLPILPLLSLSKRRMPQAETATEK